MLNIISGWGIVATSKYLTNKLKIKSIYIILIVITGLLFIFEIKERLDNPSLLFFNRDSYFVSDRILKDKIGDNFTDTVYTPFGQIQDFRLYPNFNRLTFKPLINNNFPKTPFYVLYSRNSVQKLWSHADNKLWDEITNEKVLDFLRNFRLFYADQSPIVDYNGIVFSHVKTNKVKFDTLFALDRMSNENIFVSENENLTFSLKNNHMIELGINKKNSKYSYFYTFSNNDEFPKYNTTKIPDLKPLRTYIVEISLNNADYIDNLIIKSFRI